jgi:hypothetical protein
MLRLDALNADGETWMTGVMQLYSVRASSDAYGSAVADRHCWWKDWAKGHQRIWTLEYLEYLELRLQTTSGEIVIINGSTIRSITKPVPVIDWEKLRKRWSHMEDVPPQRNCGGRVDILIGFDLAVLITPSEARIGKDDEPTTSRIRLGWTLQGIVGPDGEWSTARAGYAPLHTSHPS